MCCWVGHHMSFHILGAFCKSSLFPLGITGMKSNLHITHAFQYRTGNVTIIFLARRIEAIPGPFLRTSPLKKRCAIDAARPLRLPTNFHRPSSRLGKIILTFSKYTFKSNTSSLSTAMILYPTPLSDRPSRLTLFVGVFYYRLLIPNTCPTCRPVGTYTVHTAKRNNNIRYCRVKRLKARCDPDRQKLLYLFPSYSPLLHLLWKRKTLQDGTSKENPSEFLRCNMCWESYEYWGLGVSNCLCFHLQCIN